MAQRKTHKTARGTSFDMERFVQSKSDTIAVGNLGGNYPTNAKGDILGKGGKIEIKREDIVRQYYREDLPKSKEASIKNATGSDAKKDTVFKSPTEALQELEEENDTEEKTTKSTRRKKSDN